MLQEKGVIHFFIHFFTYLFIQEIQSFFYESGTVLGTWDQIRPKNKKRKLKNEKTKNPQKTLSCEVKVKKTKTKQTKKNKVNGKCKNK